MKGSTTYQDRVWPEPHWLFRTVVHQIHLREFQQKLAEEDARSSASC
jgi:hypothetical protein